MPVGLPASAVEGLELVRVEGLRLIFNELMASERPSSRQLRYLIGSLHGFLFAPATRVLAAPGWDAASRRGVARFLIRRSVCVRYLASWAWRRVVGDFAAAYGIRPVLAETFVAGQLLPGGRLALCRHRAPASWRNRRSARWRRTGTPAWRRVLAPGDGLDSAAENEFGAAPLGDARLTQRPVRSTEVQARSPTKTFFAARRRDTTG